MPKNKPNKGLLKRIRVTKNGRVKVGRAFGRHLRSHKSGKLRRSYRKPMYAAPCEARRAKAMLWTSVKGGRHTAPAAAAEGTAESTD